MRHEAIIRVDDLWDGEMRGIELCGISLLLINLEGRVFAYENRCPHKGVRLSEGTLDGTALTCSAHHWSFDVCEGCGINPTSARLRAFDVRRVNDDLVGIDLSPQVIEEQSRVQ